MKTLVSKLLRTSLDSQDPFVRFYRSWRRRRSVARISVDLTSWGQEGRYIVVVLWVIGVFMNTWKIVVDQICAYFPAASPGSWIRWCVWRGGGVLVMVGIHEVNYL